MRDVHAFPSRAVINILQTLGVKGGIKLHVSPRVREDSDADYNLQVLIS